MRAERAEELRDREEHGDGLRPDLQREDLADRQVAGAGARGGEEEDHRPADRLRGCVQRADAEEFRADGQQHTGQDVGAGDHLPAPDGIEQPAEGQRPEQVTDRERHEVVGGVGGLDMEEELEDQAVGEEDRVVQERLRDHQRGAQHGARWVVPEEHPQQGQVADLVGRPDLDLPAGVHRRQLSLGRRDIVLDLADRPLGRLLPAVHDLPARALRQVAPHEDDDQREHRADQEGDPPAPDRRDVVERHKRDDRAEERAGPVGAVDGEVHPAAVLRGDHLVDGRVDRGVLAADARCLRSRGWRTGR